LCFYPDEGFGRQKYKKHQDKPIFGWYCVGFRLPVMEALREGLQRVAGVFGADTREVRPQEKPPETARYERKARPRRTGRKEMTGRPGRRGHARENLL